MTAEWPQKFVYVCSATAGAVVNRAPMLHAGAGKVVGVVILRATSQPEEADWTPSDRAQAGLPAERLVAYARSTLGLRSEDVMVLSGHPDRFTDWTGALNEAASMALTRDAEVVFNVTGGTVPCKIGALMGFEDGDGMPAMRIASLRRDPFGVDLVSIGEDGVMAQAPLTVDARLSLKDYLASYSLQETDPEARRVRQDKFRSAAPIGERMMERLAETNDKRLFSDVFGELYRGLGDLKRTPAEIKLSQRADRLLRSLELDVGVRDLSFEPDRTMRLTSDFALSFAKGGWLEALVYAKVQTALQGRNDTEIAAGLELEYGADADSNRHRAIAEIDVVILADERPLLIEAKAVVSMRAMNRAVDRIAQIRQRLGGAAAPAWIVAPLLEEPGLEAIDAIRNAEEMGIRILTGPDAVTHLVDEVTRSLKGEALPHESRV